MKGRIFNTPLHFNRQDTIPELVSDLREDPRMVAIIRVFMDEFPIIMDSILSSAHENNRKELLSSVHKLKGAAASAGFSRLSDLAGKVEDLAKENQFEAAIPLLDTLDRICHLARQRHDQP